MKEFIYISCLFLFSCVTTEEPKTSESHIDDEFYPENSLWTSDSVDEYGNIDYVLFRGDTCSNMYTADVEFSIYDLELSSYLIKDGSDWKRWERNKEILKLQFNKKDSVLIFENKFEKLQLRKVDLSKNELNLLIDKSRKEIIERKSDTIVKLIKKSDSEYVQYFDFIEEYMLYESRLSKIDSIEDNESNFYRKDENGNVFRFYLNSEGLFPSGSIKFIEWNNIQECARKNLIHIEKLMEKLDSGFTNEDLIKIQKENKFYYYSD